MRTELHNSTIYRESTVADVLAHYNKDISLYRGGFMRSPFRDEDTPSFHISPSGRGWKDFGDDTGGGVIDLVMRLEGCSREKALAILVEIETGERPALVTEYLSRRKVSEPSALTVLSAGPFTSKTLLDYSDSRQISRQVLSRYCEQVRVSLSGSGNGKAFNYIGFANSGGSYVLRSPGQFGKRCTGSFPTFLGKDGFLCDAPTDNAVLVFEGFFDFLSYVEMGVRSGEIDSQTLSCGCDVCVLNSVSNKDKAKDFVSSHGVIALCLDNDKAGREAAEYFRSASEAATVVDLSSRYGDCNDVNEYLMRHSGTPM